jgi:predicted amino acid dehydrogenase
VAPPVTTASSSPGGVGYTRAGVARKELGRAEVTECRPGVVGWAGMTTLALTGSTGHVGGAVARLLAADGIRTRLLVRDPA